MQCLTQKCGCIGEMQLLMVKLPLLSMEMLRYDLDIDRDGGPACA